MFLGCRISKNVADPSDFPPLTYSSLQQEIPEEEAVKLASVQVASEKQAAQHGPLLRRNVEGVKLEAAYCLKLGQTLRVQCETAISEVFQGCSRTILFLRLVFLQKAPDREQSFPLHHLDTCLCSEDRLHSRCLCIDPSAPHTLALLPLMKRQVFCVGDRLKMVKHKARAAMGLQRHIQFELVWLHSCNSRRGERKFKPIINISHERMNNVEI